MLATLTLGGGWISILQLSICMDLVEHMHTCNWVCKCFTWACAFFQLNMCMLSVEHVYAVSWAYEHFELSMCTLPVEHMHCDTSSYTPFQLSMWMIYVHISDEHVHTSEQWIICSLTFKHINMHAYRYASAHLHLSMHTLPGEHVHIFSWANALFQLSLFKLSVLKACDASSWTCAHF